MTKRLNVIYSQASPKDEPAIFNLLTALEGDRSNFDISKFYIAKVGNNLIGCVRIKLLTDDCLELSSLAVNKNYQGKGIGSKLVEELLSKETARPIFLFTQSNKESFYNKFNFKTIEAAKLPAEFKKEYERIINLPFAKDLEVIVMIVK
jgi:N-acetylglutamate synthase-like GNAT family acetyltransferase